MRRMVPCVLGLALLLGACAQSPIGTWQGEVERFTLERGNGDLNALRMASDDGDRFDFVDRRARLLEMFPSNRRDVHALVLGMHTLGDAPWQVFIVGVVRYSGTLARFPLGNPRVEDIRLAAVQNDGNGFRWRMGEGDKVQLARYVGAQEGKDSTFPSAQDRWKVRFDGPAVRVVDERSGAAWSLSLGDHLSSTDQ